MFPIIPQFPAQENVVFQEITPVTLALSKATEDIPAYPLASNLQHLNEPRQTSFKPAIPDKAA
jgi:hypothetical protein